MTSKKVHLSEVYNKQETFKSKYVFKDTVLEFNGATVFGDLEVTCNITYDHYYDEGNHQYISKPQVSRTDIRARFTPYKK